MMTIDLPGWKRVGKAADASHCHCRKTSSAANVFGSNLNGVTTSVVAKSSHERHLLSIHPDQIVSWIADARGAG